MPKPKFEVIIYWSEEDQVFVAEAPELPDCAADGKTHRNALHNVEGIIQEWLETARHLGRSIPKPRGRLALPELAILDHSAPHAGFLVITSAPIILHRTCVGT